MTRVDVVKLGHEIRAKIKRDSDKRIHRATKKVAEEVRDYWAMHTAPAPWNVMPTKTGPYATGDYAMSIHVKRTRARFGFLAWQVHTEHPNAVFIEEGTGVDKPGSRSPWGPRTPTPARWSAARAAFHFEGTDDS